MKNYTLIGPFNQLLTFDKLPLKGSLADSELEIIEDAGILIADDQIVEVGDFKTLAKGMEGKALSMYIMDTDSVCLPAFVDCHTHIAFAGSRENDFALRNAGSSYLEIANAGGGIWSTVKHTRAVSEDELIRLMLERTNFLLEQGITTIEIKSGYGLSVHEELKILRAIKKVQKKTLATLVPTCLAAHTLPKDFEGTNKDYLESISSGLFPVLKEERLSNRIDAFIEESAFSADDIADYFSEAKKLKFDLTVHADQFTTSGSAMAVKFKARSADHLEASGDREIENLANSDVVAVALPGASMGLGCPFAPARKLLDAGASLAIASDWNPGSAPMGNLLTQASVLATFEKLSNAEVLSALTFRAANALGLKDRGRLVKKMKADFCIYPTDNYQNITYLQGSMKPAQVWVNGVFHDESKHEL